MAHRKLIRPDFNDVREQHPIGLGRRKSSQDKTNAESFYYLKQMNQKTPMCVQLLDGEQIDGWIEWYDRSCLKIHRESAPNLLVMKHQIKYMHKAEPAQRTTTRKSATNGTGRKRPRSS